MVKKDYYGVLGISKFSDEKEIKKAYRKLAKKYHPDTNQGDKEAEQKFKDITEAYNVLSDPEKKKMYDQFGFAAFDGSMGAGNSQNSYSGWKNNGSPSHFEGGDMEDFFGDIFDSMFGAGAEYGSGKGFRHGFGGYAGEGQRKGRDIESDLRISFDEAALGCSKRISFEGNQSIEVRIPAGIDEGQSVRLKGKGQPGTGGMPAGDLYLKVHIAEKPGYERRGMDVYTTANIPYTTAVLGGEAVFRTLYGDVKCKIPAGTQSGSKIRLKQKGIVSMKDNSVRGDAYVTILIAVPRSVTPREREMLEELRKVCGG